METRIGCKRDARKALMGVLSPVRVKDVGGWDDRPARGASRAAFVSPDGATVYKVCHSNWAAFDTLDADNREEMTTISHCRKSPVGQVYVMPTTMWVIDGLAVNAQPRLSQRGDELRRSGDMRYADLRHEIDEAARTLGISDMHDGNWGITPDGRAWIIDANVAMQRAKVTPAPAPVIVFVGAQVTNLMASEQFTWDD